MKKSIFLPLLAAISFFCACLYYSCHLHALYAETQKLQNTLSEKNLLVKKIDALRARYPDIELAAQAEAAACQRWRQKLPDHVEADSFIESLCAEAQKNGLSIVSIKTSPADDRHSLIVNIELNGGFPAFLAFFKNLERLPRFNESDSFKVEKTGEKLRLLVATRIFALGGEGVKNSFAKEPSFSI